MFVDRCCVDCGNFSCLFGCTVETGYKVTAYKVKSVIKSLYHSPNMPLKSKFRLVIT